MDLDALNKIAVKMVTPGKGILAADESTGTIKKRFDSINTESTFEKRRDWREMLFRTDKAMQDHISGVILFDETIRQEAKDGTPLVDLLHANDAIPGIKVDMGTTPLAGRPGETVTQGLDGLRERLAEYYELGARFAKWRAVIEISHPDQYVGATPTLGGIKANTHALGRYAALCQEANIVPIVEPEVLMGGHHSVERCHEVTEMALNSLFTELYEQGVALEGVILKPNMVMNKIGGFPWKMTYSYGRALQQSALKAWKGDDANYEAAQIAFYKRAHMNGLASKGEWSSSLENA